MGVNEEYIAKQLIRLCVSICEREMNPDANYSEYVVAVNKRIGRTSKTTTYEKVHEDFKNHGFDFVLDVCRVGKYFIK